jgi:hypothetical protein
VSLDEATITKLDPTKILQMPLDAIVDSGFEARMVTMRFAKGTTSSIIMTAAGALQSAGHAVTLRFGQLHVLNATELTQEDVRDYELFPDAKIFTDIKKDKIPTAEALAAREDGDAPSAVEDAAVDTEPVPPTDAPVLKAAMPKTAAAWKQLMQTTKLTCVKPTFGAWVAINLPKSKPEETFKTLAPILADEGIVIEWRGKTIG